MKYETEGPEEFGNHSTHRRAGGAFATDPETRQDPARPGRRTDVQQVFPARDPAAPRRVVLRD